VLIAQVKAVREVSEQTYYSWRKDYGGLAIEAENPLHPVVRAKISLLCVTHIWLK